MGNHALPSWPIKRAVQRSGSRRNCGKVLSQEIRDGRSAPAILTFHCLDRFVCQRRNFWCQDDKIILVRALDCYHLLELLCRNVKLDKTGFEFALCVYHHEEFSGITLSPTSSSSGYRSWPAFGLKKDSTLPFWPFHVLLNHSCGLLTLAR